MDYWETQKRYNRLLAQETALQTFKTKARFSACLIYPNTYFVGMSNLGFHAVFNIINSHPDFYCERAFLPEAKDEPLHKKGPQKLYSLEELRLLSDFDIMVFSISYELDYFNVLKMLYYGGIPLKSGQRNQNHPLIIAGGAAVTLNPQPIADFTDCFVIGEGENTINELLDLYSQCNGKENFLKNLSFKNHFYVPKYFKDDKKITRHYIDKITNPASNCLLTKNTEFKNTFLVELTRGCPYSCNFCVVGNRFAPYRHAEFEGLAKIIKPAREVTNKIGLISSSIADYPRLKELADLIYEYDFTVSFSSLRSDRINEHLLKILVKSEQKTLTFAPEAVSAKLKKIINKNISEKNIYDSLDLCLKHNIKNFKLYFMLGLPKEAEEDAFEIINFLKRISAHLYEKDKTAKIKASVSQFIPKPFTPFQWQTFENENFYNYKLKLIKNSLADLKNAQIGAESPKNAYISNLLSRGGKNIGEFIEKNFLDFNYNNFYDQTKNLKFNLTAFNQILPWDFMQTNEEKERLWLAGKKILK